MRPKRRAMASRPIVFPRLPPASGDRSSERLDREMIMRAAHARLESRSVREEKMQMPPLTNTVRAIR